MSSQNTVSPYGPGSRLTKVTELQPLKLKVGLYQGFGQFHFNSANSGSKHWDFSLLPELIELTWN